MKKFIIIFLLLFLSSAAWANEWDEFYKCDEDAEAKEIRNKMKESLANDETIKVADLVDMDEENLYFMHLKAYTKIKDYSCNKNLNDLFSQMSIPMFCWEDVYVWLIASTSDKLKKNNKTIVLLRESKAYSQQPFCAPLNEVLLILDYQAQEPCYKFTTISEMEK